MRVMIFVLAAVWALAAGCTQNAETSIPYSAIPPGGDAERGAQLFNQTINLAPACSGCHTGQENAASPDLTGFGAAAGTRVVGQDAREYAFYSIAEPGQHIVEGYGNVMYNQYDEKLTPQQIADLIAYLLTL